LKFQHNKTIVYIIFFLQIISSSLFASSIPAQMDSLIMQGKEYIYQLNISKAQHTFDEIILEYPDYPQGYFYRAYLTLIVFSQDMLNDSLSNELSRQIDLSVNKADDYKDNISGGTGSTAAIDAEFYLGVSYGLDAIIDVVNRNYFGGYWSGRKAKNHLEKVIEKSPDYNDAYLGLGIFHYYVDLLPGIVKFVAGILGFDGDKSKGRQEVMLTRQKGHYFKVEAYLTYFIIRYFLEGEKGESVIKLKELRQKYPSNPALSLILSYHYRRFGYTEQCIEMCESVPDSFVTVLPQLVDIKFYNLAVSYYDMNLFDESDSVFTELIQLRTRKSLYYQAAIKFYKGLLADLSFNRKAALYYFKNIFKHNQTKYWYYKSRMHLKYPMDSLMYKHIYAQNLLYSRQYQKSMSYTRQLKSLLDSGAKSPNPDLPFLVIDLLAENYYYIHDYVLAKQMYDQIAPHIDEIKDDFQRSWVYIHYARCLRAIGEYKTAEEMLRAAHDLDDDYTRLIIEREKYVLSQLMQTNQSNANKSKYKLLKK